MSQVIHTEITDKVIDMHPHHLCFVTISGAHIYGFASHDSDYDLRGMHVASVTDVIRLDTPRETHEIMDVIDGVDIDLVTHDVRKYFRLLLKNNGYVLEQILSPIVLRSSPEHEELCALARWCIHKAHAKHYSGFAQNQWKLFVKEETYQLKKLLYAYRVLLTGIHLMRTGELETNIGTLNRDVFRLPYLSEMIQQKIDGDEKGQLSRPDVAFHEGEFNRLQGMLEDAFVKSDLPEMPQAWAELDDLLVRMRLATLPAG